MHIHARLRMALFGGASIALVTGGAACSSKNGGTADAGGLFGTPDTGSVDHMKHDAGTPHQKDAETTVKLRDAACVPNTVVTTDDWCDRNAPMDLSASNIYCEDFDTGNALSGVFGYSAGIGRSSWVGENFVSPYCALRATIADGGPGGGAYTLHSYSTAPATGGLYVSADVFVPGTSACNGVTIGRVWISPNDVATNAGVAWVTIADLAGSGAKATGYTLELYAQGGRGAKAGPATVAVKPDAEGWARIEIALTSYTISATSVTIDALASTNAAGDDKAAGVTSSKGLSAMGSLTTTISTPGAEMDVGLIPDPSTGVVAGGCELLLDDVVSNITAPP